MLTSKTIPTEKHVNFKTMAAGDLLKYRYNFYMSMIKAYVKYAQMVESKSKAQVVEATDAMINSMVAKYSLGSQFVYDVKYFINARYMQSHDSVLENMREKSGIPGDVFEALLKGFNAKDMIPEVDKAMGNRFRSILR